MSEYSVTAEGLVHVYAAAEHGHWSAFFPGGPGHSGSTALVAAKRLVRAVKGLDESTLRVIGQLENERPPGGTDRAAGGLGQRVSGVRGHRPVRQAGRS